MNRRKIDFRFAPKQTQTCIGRPDDPFKTVVDESGALLYHWENIQARGQFRRCVEFGIAHLEDPLEVRQQTETPGSAVTVTVLRYAMATLTLTAFGYEEEGRRTDVVLWKIEPVVGTPDMPLQLMVQAQDSLGQFFGDRHPEPSSKLVLWPHDKIPQSWRGWMNSPVEMPGAPVLLVSSAPLELSWYTRRHRFFYKTDLGASRKEVLEGGLAFPLNHGETVGMDYVWMKRALHAERRFWRKAEFMKLGFRVPDDSVQEMLEACSRNLFQAREVRDGRPCFQIGPTWYRGLWMVDGYFILDAARILGFGAEADRAVKAFEAAAKPDGMISFMSAHLKETGIAIAMFVRQAEMSNDWDRLRVKWPLIRRALGYIQGLREKAKALPSDHPAHGFLPPSMPDGGVGDMLPEFTTALWLLFALKAATSGARQLRLEKDAAEFQSEFDSLMRDFRRFAKREARRTAEGIDYLPMIMPHKEWQYRDDASEPDSWRKLSPTCCTWALCQAIWPGEVFSADDPLIAQFLQLLEATDDQQGIPIESGFIWRQGLWTYYASFAAHVWLYAGRADKAVDYLYAFANHASPTRVWREEQTLSSLPMQIDHGDMPHNWASAEFVRLVRHLLVMEKGGDLHLLPGLPESWIVPGKPVVLEKTPTRYGPVSLRLEMKSGKITVRVRRDLKWCLQPGNVWLRLPARVKTCAVQGRKAAVKKGRLIALPPLSEVKITLQK